MAELCTGSGKRGAFYNTYTVTCRWCWTLVSRDGTTVNTKPHFAPARKKAS